MSVSIRPAYRSGRAPSAPPAVLAPIALLAALLLALAGAVHQLQAHEPAAAAEVQAPASTMPAVGQPRQGGAAASTRSSDVAPAASSVRESA